MNDMKLIMENWRKNTLNEDEVSLASGGPTVGAFMTALAKAEPSKTQKLLGGASKFAAMVAGGALLSLATGGMGAGVGALAGAGAEAAIRKILDHYKNESDEIAKSLIDMLSTPDDQRDELSKYFDLDDKYEALLQTLTDGLGKKLVVQLFARYKDALGKLTTQLQANPELADEPLGRYINFTANEFFQEFMRNNKLSGVGLQISAPTD